MTARTLPNGDVLFPGVNLDDIPDDQPATIQESGVPFAFGTGGPDDVEHDWSLSPDELADLDRAMDAEAGFRISELDELALDDAARRRMH